MRVLALLCLALLPMPVTAGAEPPLRLETVFPTLPGKNRVRWYEFDWKWSEFSPLPAGAPVRLFFYERERDVAEVARPFIADAYRDLVETFDYVPTQTIPFLLYNSHFEFESTRAFFVSETVLGVTSTEDLTMALPYWGEHQRFEHVMRHELAHQFTIQLVLDRARGARCNPLPLMPLWFIEGIAETYSQARLTPEVRAAIADLLVAHEGDEPEGVPDFFSEGTLTFERIYLLGHAQVRFLQQRFGPGLVRRILMASPRLCRPPQRLVGLLTSRDPFVRLVAELTGARPEAINSAWKQWAREQVLPALRARTPLSNLPLVDGLGKGMFDSFSLSPDGRILFYRTVDLDSGVARLYLRDLTDPDSEVLVTQDQRIGLVSLHPLDRRVTAVGRDMLVYIGRVGASDVLFVRRYTREVQGGRVRLRLGEKVSLDLSRFDDLLEGGYPAISPEGAVAFTGLKRGEGFLDIYQFNTPFARGAAPVRLTNDPYAEQGLAYGPDGALYFVSDATPEGNYAIFRGVEGGRAALVHFPVRGDATHPTVAGAAGLFFDSGATGWTQAYQAVDGAIFRLTDVPTSFSGPAAAYDGSLLGVVQVDGRQRLARLPRERWLYEPMPAAEGPALTQEGLGGGGLPVWDIPQVPITQEQDYAPLRNLGLAGAAGFASPGPLIAAQVLFADPLNTHLVGASAQVLEEFDRASGELTYVDLSGRTAVGGGLFASTSIQLDGDTPGLSGTYFLQRYGARILAEYPFGRYMRVQGFLAPQLLRASDFSNPDGTLARENGGAHAALQGGAGFGLDTTRLSAVGPYDGLALTVGVDGTLPFAGARPFGNVSAELLAYKNLVPGYERLFLHGRLALGTALGGAFRESFYLPAAQNLRALETGSLTLLGDRYYLAQAELRFPLLPELGGIYLQGLVGADVGTIAFEYADLLPERQAAVVLGAELLLGPLALRLSFARPFDIGGGIRYDRWLTHFSLGTPFTLL